MFETFSHTADLGLRVRADDLPELFREAGQGLLSVLLANPQDVEPVEAIQVDIGPDEVEYQLFDWLSELLYLFDTRRLLLCEFEVSISAGGIAVRCRGETMDPDRHRMEHEIKAVTYHGLKVDQSPDGWLAELIVDI